MSDANTVAVISNDAPTTPVQAPQPQTVTQPTKPTFSTEREAKDFVKQQMQKTIASDKPATIKEKTLTTKTTWQPIDRVRENPSAIEDSSAKADTSVVSEGPEKDTVIPTVVGSETTPTPETAKTETNNTPADKPKVEDGDIAKAFSKIAKKESKLLQEIESFKREKAEYSQALKNIQTMDKMLMDAKTPKGKLEFIKKLGWSQQEIVDAMVDEHIKPETQKVDDRVQDLQRQIAELKEERIKESKSKDDDARNNKASEYITGTIAPMIKSDSYKLINAEFGDSAAQVVFNTMVDEYNRRMKLPDSPDKATKLAQAQNPKYIADQMEVFYKNKFEKYQKSLGVTTTANAKPVETNTTANPTSPIASEATQQSALERSGYFVPKSNKNTYTRERSR